MVEGLIDPRFLTHHAFWSGFDSPQLVFNSLFDECVDRRVTIQFKRKAQVERSGIRAFQWYLFRRATGYVLINRVVECLIVVLYVADITFVYHHGVAPTFISNLRIEFRSAAFAGGYVGLRCDIFVGI